MIRAANVLIMPELSDMLVLVLNSRINGPVDCSG